MEADTNKDQISHNIEDHIPPFFKNMGNKANLEFDYEINKIKLETKENLNTKMYIVNSYNPKEMRIVNYNEYKDSLFNVEATSVKKNKLQKVYQAFCLKRLVSKKKKRYEDKNFDLDMTYVTKRVIAMGFPSIGCEAVYRNSLIDVTNLFRIKHNNNVKIYNLCVEKDRIYDKSLFPLSSVTLFPSKDHNPCPIKLILEFCVDLVLYLINNQHSVAAIHCKAGKGRTGVMICSYLIFSGLCQTAEEAFEYYAKVRTFNNKGVTIPSQKRYVKYFESFLSTNFCKPYVHMIPQIIKYHIQEKTKNILKNFMHDERYFVLPNTFRLNSIKIGPLPKKINLSINICNFVYKPLKMKMSKGNEESKFQDGDYFYVFKFEEKIDIDSDIKIKIGGDLEFYVWINFWYSTLDYIRQFIGKNHTDKEEFLKKKSLSRVNKLENKLDDQIDKSYDKSDRFLVINEDNQKTEIEKEVTPEEDMDVFQIIDSLNHSSNLNKIIKAINDILEKRKNVSIPNIFNLILNAQDLDKFNLLKKMKDNFLITINYEMNES